MGPACWQSLLGLADNLALQPIVQIFWLEKNKHSNNNNNINKFQSRDEYEVVFSLFTILLIPHIYVRLENTGLKTK